jgi:hypothetical protein
MQSAPRAHEVRPKCGDAPNDGATSGDGEEGIMEAGKSRFRFGYQATFDKPNGLIDRAREAESAGFDISS